jgi:hypothetical protein
MDEIKHDGCRMSGQDKLLWLYEPTRKIAVTLQSIRTFLEMEYTIAIVEEVNYTTQLP